VPTIKLPSPNAGVPSTKLIMPEPRRSKRFNPNAITDKIVPLLLLLLVLILLAVLVIVALSLVS
jgi:hypothetical protein